MITDLNSFTQLAEERRLDIEKRKAEEDELKNRKRPKVVEDQFKMFRSGVGKFLDLGKSSVS